MKLFDFLTDKERLGDNYEKFEKLKEKFKSEGIPESIANLKASEILKPDKLEKIHLVVENKEGLNKGITFFFDTEEDLILLSKYFKTNFNVMQVGNGRLIIELLKLLEECK